MKVLVVGGGGREHALVWKIAASPLVDSVIVAPGNAGIREEAECVPVAAEDVAGQLALALARKVDLVVIGPEAPLVGGLSDQLRARGIAVFGPSQAAAALEGSKAFMKDLLARYRIPSAGHRTFTDPTAAFAHLRASPSPFVIKASGLAAGKGVIVATTRAEAEAGLGRIMVEREFGEAGAEVVIEDFLPGEEASLLALVDGERVLPLAGAQDHKAVGEGDRGPNTGGMGAYSPAPVLDAALTARAIDEILLPTVRAMAREGRPYRGVLYAGLMIHEGGIRVLEFNARFGDPETQPILMRMRSDLVPLLLATATGSLAGQVIDWDERVALCVVMSAGGRGRKEKGDRIEGLEAVRGMAGVKVFHAGTEATEAGIVTAGGRVLGVTALADDVAAAQGLAYAAVDRIRWRGSYCRRDIGYRAVGREKR
ncbi:MAG: phosphoribosylamine--glycine ligase [Magnetococcales bacterium]|nr:phosphoribosylamine--glycine ligase [Magnetococcales bacterium]